MKRYVIDCSVAVKWFVPEEFSDLALGILEQLQAGAVAFLAPDSFTAELGHSRRSVVLDNEMSPQAATDALAEAAKLPIEIVDTRPFAAAAMTLALRHVGTYYDALYVALAEREDLQVLTADKRMGKAFARLNRTVRLPEILRPSQPAPSPGDKSRSAREPGAPPEDEPDRG